METDQDKVLVECGCGPIKPSFPDKDIAYVTQKLKYVKNYLKEVIIHSSERLVGVEPCYGKHLSKVRLVRASFRSYKKTLQQFKKYLSEKKFENKLPLQFPNKTCSYSEYYNSCYMLCEAFDNLFATFFNPTDLIPIQTFIDSIKLQIQTLTIIQKGLQNGECIGEDNKTNSPNRPV
jgi:hypothetical protein